WLATDRRLTGAEFFPDMSRPPFFLNRGLADEPPFISQVAAFYTREPAWRRAGRTSDVGRRTQKESAHVPAVCVPTYPAPRWPSRTAQVFLFSVRRSTSDVRPFPQVAR